MMQEQRDDEDAIEILWSAYQSMRASGPSLLTRGIIFDAMDHLAGVRI